MSLIATSNSKASSCDSENIDEAFAAGAVIVQEAGVSTVLGRKISVDVSYQQGDSDNDNNDDPGRKRSEWPLDANGQITGDAEQSLFVVSAPKSLGFSGIVNGNRISRSTAPYFMRFSKWDDLLSLYSVNPSLPGNVDPSIPDVDIK